MVELANAASVIDRTRGEDPFSAEAPDWIVHARVMSKLFVGMINRRELVSALLDDVSTPRDYAFDDTVPADLRNPADILANPVTREVIDFTRPVGLVLVAILHFINDEDRPAEIVRALVDALPSGSWR